MIYKKTDPKIWTGRKSGQELYLHEKVQCKDALGLNIDYSGNTIAILGYACDEGVKRNQGRIGAAAGPDAIRMQLGKMPNHLDVDTRILDVGSVECMDTDMETVQNSLSKKVSELLVHKAFPILLGGGHDIAYAHYNGIKKYLGAKKTIGIINFDAHFDLRDNVNGSNSGTPFFQIAQECKEQGASFEYLCLGVRKDANDNLLFKTADLLGTSYIENNKFVMGYAEHVVRTILDFIRKVDHIYATLDLDGFSSAYAPGVSATSPVGFSPGIVLECLELIIKSGKLISFDVAEMNPKYDIDNQTAKLAASLVHFVIHEI